MHNKATYFRPLLAAMLMVLSGTFLHAQRIAPVGTWTPYLSHNKTKEIVRQGDRLFVMTEGGLYWYDINTGEKKTYSPVDGLSGVNPSAFYLDTISGTFFLGYEDGMINYFTDPDEGIKLLTEIRRTDLYTTKRINNFISDGNKLYIATEFGIVIYDIDNKEVRNSVTKIGTVTTGTGVKDIDIVGDTIWVSMGNGGVFFADRNVPNITVPSVWTQANGLLGLPMGESRFLASLLEVVYAQVNDTVYQKTPGQNWVKAPFPAYKWRNIDAVGEDFLYLTVDNIMRVFHRGVGQENLLHNFRFYSAYLDTTHYFVGDSVNGLLDWYDSDSFDVYTPSGPFNNSISELAVGNGELYVAPGGRNGTGPANNFDGFYHFAKDKGWKRYDAKDELSLDLVWAEFARAYYHEKDASCYVGSWNHGFVKVQNDSVVGAWTSKNSGLSPSFNQNIGSSTRVSGLSVDRDGNVWATAILADNNLNVLTPEGKWYNFNFPTVSPVGITIDDFGNKWMNANGAGIAVFNENGTLDDPTDDQFKAINITQGSGGLPNNSVYAITKDRKGLIWVGTLEGVAVFASPGSVFSNNFADASCPVIDGFCLLRDQRVSTIAVDGANRKWLGTNTGVYVVNPQGNRLLEHYTAENSPLFSNEIRDIKIDQGTGEIFIGTSKGLISLMGDATGGKENSENLYVFPNPIPYDYDGTVAISCSVTDAEVRITNTAGQLVRSLEALGGQAVWDFRDVAGRRLAPGIYLAMVTSSDGQNAGIAKFVVLERP